MRILFDHCVPKPFRREFPNHVVKTTADMGWEQLVNGLLLAEAAKSFDLLLTVDKNMKNQQNLRTLPLPVIILDSVRNTPAALAPFAPFVELLLPKILPGQMWEIGSHGNVTEITSVNP